MGSGVAWRNIQKSRLWAQRSHLQARPGGIPLQCPAPQGAVGSCGWGTVKIRIARADPTAAAGSGALLLCWGKTAVGFQIENIPLKQVNNELHVCKWL